MGIMQSIANKGGMNMVFCANVLWIHGVGVRVVSKV